MTPRPIVSTALAALVLVGAMASAADAATRHRTHQTHAMNTRSSMSHSRTGRSAQDNMADQLNAQSLQRSQTGTMPEGPAMTAPQGTVQ